MIFFNRLLLFLLLSLASTSYAQVDNDFLVSEISDTETQFLIEKYLSTIDNAEAKIKELYELILEDEKNNDFPSLIKKMQIALVLEKHVPMPCKATYLLNVRMGTIFKEFNVSYAIRYFEKAIAISLKTKEQTDRFQLYNLLAGLYYKVGQKNNALSSYQRAIKEAANNQEQSTSVINNTGWLYAQMGENDSAMHYFAIAATFYDKESHDDLYCSIRGNIARQEELRKNYPAALQLYRANEIAYRAQTNPSNFLANKLAILCLKSDMGVKLLENEIDSLEQQLTLNMKTLNSKTVLRFYKFGYAYFQKEDPLKAASFNDRFLALKDSIAKKEVDKANILTNALLNAQSITFKNDYEVHRLESYHNKIVALMFILTAFLIIIVMVLAFQKKKKEHEAAKLMAETELKSKELETKTIKAEMETARLLSEAELKNKELEKQHMQDELEKSRLFAENELRTRDLEKKAVENELELKKKDLTNLVLHNTQVYEVNKEVISRLQEVTADDGDLLKSVKTLLSDLKTRNQMGERLSSLQSNIDQVNTEFYTKLRTKFPQLTKSEVELCGYILINLSNKDISILKNVEASSVKMSKTRLRKKLDLAPDEDLLRFIATI